MARESRDDQALLAACMKNARATMRDWSDDTLYDFEGDLHALIAEHSAASDRAFIKAALHPDSLSYEQRGLSPERRARV